jgi:hypothetical protein
MPSDVMCLPHCLACPQAAEKEVRGEVSGILREGKAATSELAAAEAAAEKAVSCSGWHNNFSKLTAEYMLNTLSRLPIQHNALLNREQGGCQQTGMLYLVAGTQGQGFCKQTGVCISKPFCVGAA